MGKITLKLKREVSTIVYSIKKFHQFLYGRYFNVITNHKPLLGILSEEKGIPTLVFSLIQRWWIILAVYNYILIYKSGLKHADTDYLSRLPNSKDKEGSV